jgi:hypothetical protein
VWTGVKKHSKELNFSLGVSTTKSLSGSPQNRPKVYKEKVSDGGAVKRLLCRLYCAEPARENVMNAHGRNPFILVVVNQPKIQQLLELGNQSFDNTLSTAS